MQAEKKHMLSAAFGRRFKWVLVVALIVAIVVGVATHFLNEEEYRADCSLYIVAASDLMGDINQGRELAEEYLTLMKTDMVINDMAARLREESLVMSADAIYKALKAERVNDTALLKITATAATPQLALALCDAAYNAVNNRMYLLFTTYTVRQVDSADTAQKVAPPVVRNGLLACLICLVLGGIVALLLSGGDRVRSEEELKQRLHVPVLGCVPALDNDRKAGV